MSQPVAEAPGGSELPVVQTEDGPVTVASIEYLEQLEATKKANVDQLSVFAAAAQQQADDAEAKAGWQLVAHSTEWRSGDWSGRIEAARALGQTVTSLSGEIAEASAREYHGISGALHRMSDVAKIDGLKSRLHSAQLELDIRYREIGRAVDANTGVAEIDDAVRQAHVLRLHSEDLMAQKDRAQHDLNDITAEIARRKDVIKQLGFDALGIQADLERNGIRPVSTSLVLKTKEVAAVQVPATLCRYATRTQYVGGSHGVSIPLGHGLRYRVSSYRGQPIQSQYLSHIDTGQLVVTNQRLVFLGSKRDVSTPVAKLIHLEPYSDAVGVGREGKESRDIFLVQRPAELLLYLHWVIGHQV